VHGGRTLARRTRGGGETIVKAATPTRLAQPWVLTPSYISESTCGRAWTLPTRPEGDLAGQNVLGHATT
jgi:hypothetical protein